MANSKGLQVLLVLTIGVMLISVEADAIFDVLFKGRDKNGQMDKLGPAAVQQSIQSDHDTDSNGEPAPERRRPAKSVSSRRIDSSATHDASQPRRPPVRRQRHDSSSSLEEKHSSGRARRNELRHSGKPVDSYLDEETDWHRGDDDEDEEAHRGARARESRGRDKAKAPSQRDEARPPRPQASAGERDRKKPAKSRDEREGGRARADDELDYNDDNDGEDDDEYDLDSDSSSESASDPLTRPKYVQAASIKRRRSEKSEAAREQLLSTISLGPLQEANRGKTRRNRPNVTGGSEGKSGADFGSKKFWKKSIESVAKATNKGLKATKKALAELPKEMGNMVDSVNTYLELDNKGKIKAIDRRVAKEADFVRAEFAKFTIPWAEYMEESLRILGDKDLDKVTWNEKESPNLRKDALHLLVIGYEFMRLMIIWRENILLAHEAFRLWLEKARRECDARSLDITTDLSHSPDEVHSYMLLVAWDFIKYDALEPQLKLDYLMELEDSRHKDYWSKYFRKIVILQEIYFPTVRELENERKSIKLPEEDQGDTYDFFMDFRQLVAEKRIDDVDIMTPKELADFVAKLTPQLRMNSLVYSKSYLKSLMAKLEQARLKRERALASTDEDEDSDYGSDYDD